NSDLGHVLKRHPVDLDNLDVVARGSLFDSHVDCTLAGGLKDVLLLLVLQDLDSVDFARDSTDGRANGVGGTLVNRRDALLHSGQLVGNKQSAASDEKHGHRS